MRPATEGGAAYSIAPNRKAGSKHARDVTNNAVGDQCRDTALGHTGAKDVAEDAGIGHAHGIDHGDHTCRHGLDGGAGRDRGGPACRRREIFARRNESQGESRPTIRGWPGLKGFVPRIQTLRRPFLSKIVVIVAVDTVERVLRSARSGGMGFPFLASGGRNASEAAALPQLS